MKFEIFLIAIILATIATLSQAGSKEKSEDIKIECTFSNVAYVYFGAKRSCTLKSREKITNRKATVIAIDGGCTPSKPDTTVQVFYAIGKVVKYIPAGFDVLFPSLIGFRLESTQLSVVTKENLKPFANLLMFASVGNPVTYLEADLFMYNVKLEYVSFRANRIQFMDPSVFSVISGTLKQFYMDGQALACGLGNAITPAAISSSLKRMNVSTCTDIVNAPPLYLMYLELQAQLEACQAAGETTTVGTTEADTTTTASGSDELKNCQDELAQEKTNSEDLKTQLDACNAKTPGGDTTTPANGGDTTPANGGDTTPANGGDTTPANGGDTTPANGGDTTPANGGDTTPANGGDTTPVNGGDTTVPPPPE